MARNGGKRSEQLRVWNRELQWGETKKYVELLRHNDDLLSIGQVDIDVPQVVRRHFLCDSHRCIHWAGQRALIDRSCCSRYGVPVSARDRQVVLEHLDAARKNLPPDHRLQDPDADPFEVSDDFGFELVHLDHGTQACQFTIYKDGMRLCALHMAALQANENPQDYKPLACSMWPLAVNDYNEDGDERLLLTVYCAETAELFADCEDEPFACIVDDHPEYPRLYQSERGVIEYAFGPAFYSELDREAKKILAD